MMKNYRNTYFLVIVSAASYVTLPTLAKGDYNYHVIVDTSSAQGTSGYLDFQLNPQQSPGPPPMSAQPLSSIITNFSTDGSLGGALTPPVGQVSGQLPSQLTLFNSASVNDFTQGIVFGNAIQFDLSLSGNALSDPLGGDYGTIFLFSLLDQNFNPLLSNSYGGNLFQIFIFGDATTLLDVFPPNDTAPPVATVTPTSVPSPASFWLLAQAFLLMLIGYGWLRDRSKRRAMAKSLVG